MKPQHMLDRTNVYVGVNVLLERRRKPTSLKSEDNIKMDLKVLESQYGLVLVQDRFQSGVVVGAF